MPRPSNLSRSASVFVRSYAVNKSAYFRKELMSKNLELNRTNLKKLNGTPLSVF